MLDKNKLLIQAVNINSVPLLRKAIKMGADPNCDGSWALRLAATNGHLEVVKLLIPVSDVKALKSDALRWAAHNEHLEVVDELKKYYSDGDLIKLIRSELFGADEI
jgi:ankyrin repeat protein